MKEAYKEEKCPVCSVKFADGDDIVVCPECGAPYHRNCYKESGECIFKDRHGNYEWKGEKQELYEHCDNMLRVKDEQKQAENDDIIITNVNSYEEFVELLEKQVIARYQDFGDTDGVTVEELVKFLNVNAKYYMNVFKDLKRNNKILKLNFSSFILFPFHSFYRRMNLFGTIILVISMILLECRILISGAPAISAIFSDGTRQLFLYLLLGGVFALNLFTLMFFNYFYFKMAIKKIKAIKTEHKDKPHDEVMRIIAAEGRPSMFGGIAFAGCAGLVCVMAFQLLNNFLGVVI